MKNTEKAVTIIAVLSLLLGFSLGQNHRQYLKLKQVKAASVAPLADFPPHHAPFPECNRSPEGLRQRLDGLRMRLEEKRAQLEVERRRLEEVQVRALEAKERNPLHFEVKDPDHGAKTIIRIVREE